MRLDKVRCRAHYEQLLSDLVQEASAHGHA
jgi:hypothetical protein